MLRIDHQHEERRAAESGTDPDVLAASEEFRFEANRRQEMYGWIKRTLVEQEYGSQKREAKGLLRSYLEKMTGLSRAQVTRLNGQYLKSGTVQELKPDRTGNPVAVRAAARNTRS